MKYYVRQCISLFTLPCSTDGNSVEGRVQELLEIDPMDLDANDFEVVFHALDRALERTR